MNMKYFPVLVLVAILLGGCDGIEERKQKYLNQAEQSFAEKDYDKARLGFMNVLKIDPKDTRALMRFAETLEKLQDWRGAVGRYRAVLELEPEHVKAKIKLGQLYLLANEMELAGELAEEVLAKEPQNSGALALKSGMIAKQGDLGKAYQLAEQAYAADPQNADAVVLLATLQELTDRRADAIKLLEKSIVEHDDDVALISLLGKLHLANDDIELAEKSFLRLQEIEPDNIDFKKQLVLFYERTRQPDKSEAVFRNIINQGENKNQAIEGLHDLYVSRNQPDKAEALLKDYISKEPDNFDLQFKLAGFYVKTKQSEAAQAIYNKMLTEEDAVSVRAKTRLAYLLEAEGKKDAAKALVDEVLKDNPGNIEALTLRGARYLENRQALQAIADLRTVLNANPDSPDVAKMLGSAHMMNNEPDLAIDMFKAAVSLNPNDLPARMQLVQLYQNANQGEQALKQLQQAKGLHENDPQVLEALAQAYIGADDIDNAKASIKQLMQLQSANPRGYHYYGLILQSEGNHKEAIAYFDEALRQQPGAVEPMTSRVQSMLAQNQFSEAVSWLDEQARLLKDNPIPLNLKGEILLAKDQLPRARSAFTKAVKMNSRWWLPHRNLSLVARASGDKEQAKTYLREGIKQADSSMQLRVELAALAEETSDSELAIAQYEKILEAEPNSDIAANNLVMLLLNEKAAEASSMRRAREVSDALLLSHKNALFRDTAGWLEYISGNYAEARKIIQEANQSLPENPEIQYHLGMVYMKLGEQESAKRYLSQAVESKADFKGKQEARNALKSMQK